MEKKYILSENEFETIKKEIKENSYREVVEKYKGGATWEYLLVFAGLPFLLIQALRYMEYVDWIINKIMLCLVLLCYSGITLLLGYKLYKSKKD